MRKSIIVAILGLGMLLFVGISGAASMTLIDTTKFTTGGTVASEDYNSHGWGEDGTRGFGEVDTNDYTYGTYVIV